MCWLRPLEFPGMRGVSWNISPRALPSRWCGYLVFAGFAWPPVFTGSSFCGRRLATFRTAPGLYGLMARIDGDERVKTVTLLRAVQRRPGCEPNMNGNQAGSLVLDFRPSQPTGWQGPNPGGDLIEHDHNVQDSYAACMWLTGRYTTHVTGVWDRTSPALRSPPRREGVGHVAAKPAGERGRASGWAGGRRWSSARDGSGRRLGAGQRSAPGRRGMWNVVKAFCGPRVVLWWRALSCAPVARRLQFGKRGR